MGLLTARDPHQKFAWNQTQQMNTMKLKSLQRKLNAITPETKIITYSSVLTIADSAAGGVDIFALIAEGTADNERIGDKIKVKSIEIRGIHSENQDSVDLYVVNPIDHSVAPAYTDFVGSPGGHYFKNKGYEVYYKGVTTGSSVNDACNFRKYYNKSPLNVHYDSSNAPDKNRFWCIIINRSGGSLTSRLSFKIKYTE